MSHRDYLVLGALAVSAWSWLTTYEWFIDCMILGAMYLYASFASKYEAA